ncbi:MAG: flippase-like domain-containing protein [Acidobacteria bacterium]|nr:flippase-like domain-containing protein [Acidobacteriota bacterium]
MAAAEGANWRTGSAKRALLTGCKLALAIGLVAYLIWRGHIAWEPIQSSLERWQYSLLALLLLALTPLGQLWRWQSLLRASRVHLPTREVFSYLMVAKFLNMALPGYFGGDVIRGFYVSRRASEKSAAAGAEGQAALARWPSTVLPSIVFDRMAGLLPLFALALVGSLGAFWYSLPARLLLFVTSFAAAGLLGAVGIFWLAYRTPEPPISLVRASEKFHLRPLFSALYEGSHQYVHNLRLIRNVLGISFLSQGLILTCFILLGTALDLRIPIISYFVLVPLGLMVMAIPISPAGLGVGQVAFLGLFRIVGTSQGANLFTLYMASTVLINMSGALLLPFFRLRAPLSSVPNLARVEDP